jgi:hypothetical protein
MLTAGASRLDPAVSSVVPEDADYALWISADDPIELYLSSDGGPDPANAVIIADVSMWQSPLTWDEYDQKYYIEVVAKEGGGDGSLTAGSTGPSSADGGMSRQVAPASWNSNSRSIVWRIGALGNPVAVAGKIYTSYDMGQSLGLLDTVTGEFTDVGPYELPEATGMTATAFAPDGTLYGTVQGFDAREGMSQLVLIDPQTGKANAVGFANPVNVVCLDFGPDGVAYVAGFEKPEYAMTGYPNLYSIDTATGQMTSIGNTGIDGIRDFAFDSAGTMWATTANELYTIDTSTGACQHAVTITGVDTATNDPAAEIKGIMFDENDVLYATAFIEGSPLFTIDTITGEATAAAQPGLFFPQGGAIMNTGAQRIDGIVQ